jgi:hypothetical protein
VHVKLHAVHKKIKKMKLFAFVSRTPCAIIFFKNSIKASKIEMKGRGRRIAVKRAIEAI